MSRARRRDFVTIVCCAVVLATILVLFNASRVGAGRITAECWWAGTTLFATGLPERWSLTFEPLPTGVFEGPSTYEQTFGTSQTAYFWQRGGGKGLFRPGAGYNDYKPVCVAVTEHPDALTVTA